MKKIFTLVAMAAMAIGVNAQDIWDASDLTFQVVEGKKVIDAVATPNSNEGLKKVAQTYSLAGGAQPTADQVKADAKDPLTMTDYVINVTKGDVTLKGVSTPDTGTPLYEVWRWQGIKNAESQANLALNAENYPQWANYVNAKSGNPALQSFEYYFMDSDPKLVGPRYVEDYWTPDCGKLPVKGSYWEISFAKKGTVMVGMFINRPSSNLYILEKETVKLLPASALTIEGFVQNNGYTWDGGASGPFAKFTVNDDYTINVGNAGNRQILAYVSFDVEAKTYLMFNPKNQLGLYGFYFQAEGGTGIETVKAAQNANAAIYNLAGQKVDAAFKGMVIMNGKKFMNK